MKKNNRQAVNATFALIAGFCFTIFGITGSSKFILWFYQVCATNNAFDDNAIVVVMFMVLLPMCMGIVLLRASKRKQSE